ncbi:ABC transporter ATP-binding protein [Desulforhabdus amnigena]|jgi:lipooligosaccharide transport system ATP-binding protein|nr:ABC transporter ATP-binding protein [Desulforhabdus amnigena]
MDGTRQDKDSMGGSPRYIIEARNLRKSFGDFVAVDDISFHLVHGECLGLLGPNGAGKTSTVRMIYGFSPLTGGSLHIFGLNMRTQWRAIRFSIGVCQQENNPDPDLTVLQNLEVFARYFDIPRKTAKEKALQLLEYMALNHRKDDTVTSLSGGMLRRLILARALINDPELLILDEPTTALDPQSRHQVWERLEELRSKGLSILLTTHNMDEASRLCDRLIIMDHGKILVQGKPSQLIREYAGRDVVEITEPSQELRTFIQSQHLMHDDLEHRLIIYGQPDDRIFEKIGNRYCKEKCIQRMATLEDVFLRLTGRELRE